MKKALEFSMVMLLILLAGVFLVTSCSNPSDGSPGATGYGVNGQDGADGGFYAGSGAITATALRLMFEEGEKVVIVATGPLTISGEIPSGKTLILSAAGNDVSAGGAFVVKGKLDIRADSTLLAHGAGGVGYLVIEGGTITGPGFVSLPVILDDSTIEFDLDSDGEYESVGVDYTKEIGAVTVAGSAYESGSVALLTASLATDIFNETTITDLRVLNLGGIVSGTIPNADSKLTLYGQTNVLGATSPFEPVGEVIVKGYLATDGTGATIIAPIHSGKITIEADARFTLANIGDTVNDAKNTPSGSVTVSTATIVNNGSVRTTTITPAEFVKMVSLFGSGEIYYTGAGVAFPGTATVPLNQNLVIYSGTVTAPVVPTGTVFSGSKTITTVEGTPGGILALSTNDFGTVDIGAIVENGGTISTTPTTVTILEGLFAEVKGVIATTATISALDKALSVPVDITLVLGGTANFATGNFSVSVPQNAAADFSTATFAGITATNTITIGGKARFGAAVPAGKITISASGEAEFVSATTPAGDLEINGKASISGALDPAGDITIGAGAEVKIDTGGSLEVAAGKSLTIGNGAGIELVTGASQIVTGTGTIKTASASGAIIDIVGVPYTIADTTGVATSAFLTAATALDGARTSLIGATAATAVYNKAPTITVNHVGAVTAPDATTAQTVGSVALGTGTTLVVTNTQIAAHKYSVTAFASLTPSTALSVDTGALKLTDTGYVAGAAASGIFNITGLRLKNSLLEVAAPEFNIAITTVRAN